MEHLTVRWLGEDVAASPQLEELLYSVLYADFGVPESGDWLTFEPGSATALVLGDDGALLGTARLLPAPGDARRKVRQVAVVPGAQSRGVGRAAMQAVEARAAAQGATHTWLDARDTAFAFYQRLGYEFESDTFISELTGIPHRTMSKRL